MILKTLPRIILVDDYHILLNIPWEITQYLGITVKCKELGYSGGNYVGIIYQGKFPSKNKIQTLMRNQGITYDNIS